MGVAEFRNPLQAAEGSGRAVLLAVIGLATVLSPAWGRSAAASHQAEPGNAGEAAILRAIGDEVVPGHVRNSCGAEVRPLISYPAQAVAVVVEADPTGACSGSNPPSSLAVVLRTPSGWRLSTSTTGTSYEVGRDGGSGMPSIIVEYPPSQVGCPVLTWTGRNYEMTRPCSASGS